MLDRDVQAIVVAHDADEQRELSGYPVISGHFSLSTLLKVCVVGRDRPARTEVACPFPLRLLAALVLGAQGVARISAIDHALGPLDEFLAEPQVAEATDNIVCRMLLGDDPDIPELGFIAPEQVYELASRSIAALKTLGFVGVLELDNSIWSGLSRF